MGSLIDNLAQWIGAPLQPATMAFGATPVPMQEIAGRLVLLLGLLVLLLGLTRWLYNRLALYSDRWAQRTLQWSRRHPWLHRPIARLVDRDPPAARARLLWFCLLLGGSWLFLDRMEGVLAGGSLTRADYSIYQLLQGLRDPLGDRVMIAFSELGDGAVTVPLVTVVLLWLSWRRAWSDAFYWLVASACGALLVRVIKVILQIPRPVNLYSGASAYSFPSGHATMSVVIYGSLAVLIANTLPPRRRWLPFAVAGPLIAGIGLSRLYLGAHWLSDVVGGIALGTAWVALIALIRHWQAQRSQPPHDLPIIALAAIGVVGAWHISTRMEFDLTRYAVRHRVETLAAEAWREKRWQQLPAYRQDLTGALEQPLNIQWAGPLPMLRRQLLKQGWHAPPPLTWGNALRWLTADPRLETLPVPPQTNAGRWEALLLVHSAGKGTPPGEQLIVRLWQSHWRLTPGDVPVWVGTLTWLQVRHLPLLRIPGSADNYDQALRAARPLLGRARQKLVTRPSLQGGMSWDGKTLLLHPRRSDLTRQSTLAP